LVSSAGIWKTPKPSWGIVLPSLRVMSGTVLVVVTVLLLLWWVCVPLRARVVRVARDESTTGRSADVPETSRPMR